MKAGSVVCVGLFVAVACVQQVLAYAEKEPAEVQVVAASGSDSFTIGKNDVVRLETGGPAGAKESVTIAGPAKVTRKVRVRRVVDGRSAIGASGVEYEITPTGKGSVVVKIKVVSPSDPGNPETTEYNFEVE